MKKTKVFIIQLVQWLFILAVATYMLVANIQLLLSNINVYNTYYKKLSLPLSLADETAKQIIKSNINLYSVYIALFCLVFIISIVNLIMHIYNNNSKIHGIIKDIAKKSKQKKIQKLQSQLSRLEEEEKPELNEKKW